ncbi:hypothetical protein HDU93_007894 [Gonapodya sp. JEL0774]|nr:hypothetical protein HDU93_007894 [Gonapodya sp. JEL0774]
MEAAQNYDEIITIEGKLPPGEPTGAVGVLKRKRRRSAESGGEHSDEGDEDGESESEHGVDRGAIGSATDVVPNLNTVRSPDAMELDDENATASAATETEFTSALLAHADELASNQKLLVEGDPADSESSSGSTNDDRPTRRRPAKRSRGSAAGGNASTGRRRAFGKRQARRPGGVRKADSTNGEDEPDDDDGGGSAAGDGGIAGVGGGSDGDDVEVNALHVGGRAGGQNGGGASRPARTARREPDRESVAVEGDSDEDAAAGDEEEDEGRWDDPDFGTGKPINKRSRGAGGKTPPSLAVGRQRGAKVTTNGIPAGYPRGNAFKRGRGGWGTAAPSFQSSALGGLAPRIGVGVDDTVSGKDSRFASGSYSDAAPIKPRVPNSRTSIMEMNRRVKQLWEWCGRARAGMGLNPIYDPANEVGEAVASAKSEDFADGQYGSANASVNPGSNSDADLFDGPPAVLLERFSRRLYEFRSEFMVFGMARGGFPTGASTVRAAHVSSVPSVVVPPAPPSTGEDVAVAALLASFSGSAALGEMMLEGTLKVEKPPELIAPDASSGARDEDDSTKKNSESDTHYSVDSKDISAIATVPTDKEPSTISPTSDFTLPINLSTTDSSSADKENGDSASVRTGNGSDEDDEEGDEENGDEEEEGDFVEAGRRRRRTTNTTSSSGTGKSRGKASRGRGRGSRGGRSVRARRGVKGGNTTPPGDQEESDTESTEASVRGRVVVGSNARRNRRSA